ncbi:ABC-F family ATP-binding cassette domain-containing protein [Azospirillum halopraeferens]|uniref:ABC-F family ATP-binding cassette domain-containing protein n=1 Tax=Azospirillum halopraeferens TaxID=34010 RepID=UPI000420D078|nr:ABC-F family ATP-binding cassette domain-containing protein [Azospirillum halopraeferens]
MLHINELTFRYGGRVLFDHATAVVPKGHRVALVGRNGTGKSTLLKLIAGRLTPDGGSITLPAGVRFGMVAQEAPAGDTSLIDTVLAADTERSALLAEADTATDPARIGEIHTRLADIEAHTAPARAAQILAGLGFDAEAQQRPCAAFSGGWRMRVALAGVLFSRPDLLLLDEPTNHLDLEATLWLENYLRNYPHTVLLVSHDRDLLNSIPTTTIHVDNTKLVTYAGGYDQFLRIRRANIERLQARAAKQEAVRKHLQSFIDRFRAKATKARQAQSRIKALERMEPVVGIEDDESSISFNFPQPDALPPPLITLENLTVGYGERPILKRLNLRIDMDDRIALLGANGNGKSTLVKLLAGRLTPMDGEMRRPSKLRVGYFAQHQAEELNLDYTPIRQVQATMPLAPEEKVRAHLGRFGFPQTKAETRIADLSGGEKARLLLALMSREAPHILMLDEPTNHLDVDSREALIQAINAFEGAVILISHDPHLIELTADRLLLVADGTCQPYDGDLDDYRRMLLEKARAERSAGDAGRDSGPSRKDQRRASAEARAALAPLKRKATDAEKLVTRLSDEKSRLQERLADPALYDGPADALTKVQKELGALEKRLAAAEEEWLAAAEAYEAAAGEAGVAA